MRIFYGFLLACLLASPVSRAQMKGGSSPQPQPTQPLPNPYGAGPDIPSGGANGVPGAQMEKRQQLERNKQRQQQIKRDTDKLLQLATELKLSVDKTDENQLSLEVIRKAEEIEKLARTVREKMRANN
jgi:hypothetical protein